MKKPIKPIIKNKVAKIGDKKLIEALKGQPIEDWRNWGDNTLKMIAEEADKRGLLKLNK